MASSLVLPAASGASAERNGSDVHMVVTAQRRALKAQMTFLSGGNKQRVVQHVMRKYKDIISKGGPYTTRDPSRRTAEV